MSNVLLFGSTGVTVGVQCTYIQHTVGHRRLGTRGGWGKLAVFF